MSEYRRASVINAIERPLGFFSLALLIVEVFLGIVLGIPDVLTEGHRYTGMWVGVFLFIGLIVVVTLLAVFKREA